MAETVMTRRGPRINRRRFDSLQPGSLIVLEFPESHPDHRYEGVIFLGIRGKGDERCAAFAQYTDHGFLKGREQDNSFEWEAYRFDGRWAYGSGAAPLRCDEVLWEPSK
jgi:hypothetical protein